MTKFGLMIEPLSINCYNEDMCPAIRELKQIVPGAEVITMPNGLVSASCPQKYYQMAQIRISQICNNCDKNPNRTR